MLLSDGFFSVDGVKCENDLLTFLIRLNPDHTIFKAHFPGSPILPGVCQVQILTELLEQHLDRKLYLSEIKNLKFLSVLNPMENTTLEVSIQKLSISECNLKVTALLLTSEKFFAKISLTYIYTPI